MDVYGPNDGQLGCETVDGVESVSIPTNGDFCSKKRELQNYLYTLQNPRSSWATGTVREGNFKRRSQKSE
jgi:hypothetical protein